MTTTPRFVEPQLATLADGVGEGAWMFERKLDGIRLLAIRDRDDVRLLTRNRIDRSADYTELVDALRDQPVERFVVDGEVVAFDGSVTSFSRLQQRGHRIRGRSVPVYLYLFDLIHLDGDDVGELPLRRRKVLLRDRFSFRDPLRFCPHRNGDEASDAEFLDDACGRGWEGLVAKRPDRPYRSGRSRDWVKLKCVAQQEFVIGGFTEPRGSRRGVGSLLLGYHGFDDGADGNDCLNYAGRVGTGFDESTLLDLSEQLQARERTASPFRAAPTDDATHWVTPDLVCEVGFTEWTTAGRLRHPRFLGLRDDKDAVLVVREVPEDAP